MAKTTPKRVLLISEDSLIANYHRLRFESMGIIVDTARSADAGRSLARDKHPDLTLIDPVFAAYSPIQAIEVMKEVAEGPVWVMSRMPMPVARAMQKAGADKVPGLGAGKDGDIFDQAAETLGVTPSSGTMADPMREDWVQSISATAPEAINGLRKALHDFVRDPRNGVGLYEIFRQTHQMSHRVWMLRLNSVGRLTNSLEALVYDLYAMPEQINPSVVRTVSQAIDFLALLLEKNTIEKLEDSAAASVFVVDDEPAARQMIGAAMKLVQLTITCADDPGMALSILEDNCFDLIFLDVNMPQGSGFELCAQIRKLEDHVHTPVVFLTGMNNFQNRAQGSLSGGNDFIGKPFNLLELGVKALMWVFKGQLEGLEA